jgi:hypothetical protein
VTFSRPVQQTLRELAGLAAQDGVLSDDERGVVLDSRSWLITARRRRYDVDTRRP